MRELPGEQAGCAPIIGCKLLVPKPRGFRRTNAANRQFVEPNCMVAGALQSATSGRLCAKAGDSVRSGFIPRYAAEAMKRHKTTGVNIKGRGPHWWRNVCG